MISCADRRIRTKEPHSRAAVEIVSWSETLRLLRLGSSSHPLCQQVRQPEPPTENVFWTCFARFFLSRSPGSCFACSRSVDHRRSVSCVAVRLGPFPILGDRCCASRNCGKFRGFYDTQRLSICAWQERSRRRKRRIPGEAHRQGSLRHRLFGHLVWSEMFRRRNLPSYRLTVESSLAKSFLRCLPNFPTNTPTAVLNSSMLTWMTTRRAPWWVLFRVRTKKATDWRILRSLEQSLSDSSWKHSFNVGTG